MPTKIEKDEITGTDTTGHEWDGIKELNTPLPMWWVRTFQASVVVAVVMWLLYPSIPYGPGYFPGLLGYSQRVDGEAAVRAAREAQGGWIERIAAATPAQILADSELRPFALEGGRAAFGTNCAPCHGGGGAGQAGVYPALVDDDWLWGGTIAAIHDTISHGIRNGSDGARDSMMPAFKEILKPAEIEAVTAWVLSLSEPAPASPKLEAGAAVFAENCAVCHGDAGQGNIEVGAPRLSDHIWLYGRTAEQIASQIREPKHGWMPAWSGRLSPETIKMLAVYVYSLGGGQPEPAAAAAAAEAATGAVVTGGAS